MEGNVTKTLAPLFMVEILQKYSDCDHPMTQAQIIERLEKDYGLTVERKTIKRNLENLSIAGYDVVSTAKGCYLDDRKFEESELTFLLTAVLTCNQMPACYAKDLVKKIASLGTVYFEKNAKRKVPLAVKNVSDNKEFLDNFEVLADSIEKGKAVEFVYNSCDEQGRMTSTWQNVRKVVPEAIARDEDSGEYVLEGRLNSCKQKFALDKISRLRSVEE